VLEAARISCIRNDKTIFQDISFTLSPGEALQIVGPNGSGKSSLIRILCTLLEPDAGELLWHGARVSSGRERFLAQLRYLGHENGLKSGLTVLENLRFAFALAGTPERPPGTEVLAQVGLTGMGDTLAGRLSAGQQRRAALARLLLGRARLWLLDEPFSSLDPAGRALLQRMFAGHCATGGMIVLTAHEPAALGDLTGPHIRLPA